MNKELLQSLLRIFSLIIIVATLAFVLDSFHNLEKTSVQITPVKKIRILIVPGHEPADGGTIFGNVKERDMAVKLGEDLMQFLNDSGKYEVVITRNTEEWNQTFADYFKNNWDEIVSWQKEAKQQFSSLVSSGLVKTSFSAVTHNIPSPEVGLRIYGITKWANENNIDAVIHIHFNDYRRRSTKVAGKYSGFAIYVPAKEYSNSEKSLDIGQKIFKRISENVLVSNLKIEGAGVISDSKLIALGQFDTSKVPSVLIEYGYIYEPQFLNSELRDVYLKNLANQTYFGIEDFFQK